jgi:hypothetical protein
VINPMRTVRSAILTLGLLGSAALTGMGSLSAHAAQSNSIRSLNLPTLQMTPGNCGAYIAGSHFTPGGVVDLYVYGTDGLYRSFKEYPVWLPLWGAVPGTFSQAVSDGNNATTLEAIAYDETTHQYSNWSFATEYCLQ